MKESLEVCSHLFADQRKDNVEIHVMSMFASTPSWINKWPTRCKTLKGIHPIRLESLFPWVAFDTSVPLHLWPRCIQRRESKNQQFFLENIQQQMILILHPCFVGNSVNNVLINFPCTVSLSILRWFILILRLSPQRFPSMGSCAKLKPLWLANVTKVVMKAGHWACSFQMLDAKCQLFVLKSNFHSNILAFLQMDVNPAPPSFTDCGVTWWEYGHGRTQEIRQKWASSPSAWYD